MTLKKLERYRDLKAERDYLREQSEKDETLRVVYNETIQRLTGQLAEIERAIETLEPRERQAIRMHYIDGMTWEEIGYKMYYERSQIFRIRKAAIEKLKNA
jgi:RNA polymerase sigma factor (sigma-70 family)